MKRPFTGRAIIRYPEEEIRTKLSQEQLTALGLVAHTYNYAEAAINRMLGPTLTLPFNLHKEVASRINGLDGRIELIKLGADRFDLPSDMLTALREALGEGAFKQLRKYRDAVVHARVLDADLGIGELVERRGKQTEVLLTAAALNALANHLEPLACELTAYLYVLTYARLRWDAKRRDVLSGRAGPSPKRSEQGILDGWIRAQAHRTRRLSLPPLPEFPEESPELPPKAPRPLLR